MTRYDIGDVVVLTAVATTVGKPAAGMGVFTVRAPGGTISKPAVTANAGTYTAKVPIDESGEWLYAFDLSGDAPASAESKFSVRRRAVPRS